MPAPAIDEVSTSNSRRDLYLGKRICAAHTKQDIKWRTGQQSENLPLRVTGVWRKLCVVVQDNDLKWEALSQGRRGPAAESAKPT